MDRKGFEYFGYRYFLILKELNLAAELRGSKSIYHVADFEDGPSHGVSDSSWFYFGFGCDLLIGGHNGLRWKGYTDVYDPEDICQTPQSPLIRSDSSSNHRAIDNRARIIDWSSGEVVRTCGAVGYRAGWRAERDRAGQRSGTVERLPLPEIVTGLIPQTSFSATCARILGHSRFKVLRIWSK
ncbi:hypothetical protein J6590_054451 [Homalodisca vitripennis]|nr:hypothetical protein J6590_054451 [Homalodisca vitripennis]